MLIALIAKDKKDHLDVRKRNRDKHLAYLSATGVVIQAGPFLDDEGQMCGSLLILDVSTMEAAQAWVADDPYTHAGLFETVELIAWNKVI